MPEQFDFLRPLVCPTPPRTPPTPRQWRRDKNGEIRSMAFAEGYVMVRRAPDDHALLKALGLEPEPEKRRR